MIETSNLARNYTHIFFSENIPFSIKALLILLMLAFYAKNQHFFAKIVALLKATVCKLTPLLEIFEFFFQFL